MMVVAAGVLRTRQFVLADRAVAIGVELSEQRIGAGFIDAVIAERRLEFRLTDLPVTVGIEFGEKLRLPRSVRRRCQFALADRAVAVGVELGE